jgi:cytochrome c553
MQQTKRPARYIGTTSFRSSESEYHPIHGSAIAGQPQEYLVRQMRDFRDGKRPATIMTQIAKGYTEEQYQLIAAFFASQKTKRGAP